MPTPARLITTPERSENEAWLRTLVEGIPQLVWRSQACGSWTWSSPQWQAYTGQNMEETRGEGWYDALHPADRDPVRRAWRAALEEGEFSADHRIRSVEGQYRWFQTRAIPVLLDDGTVHEWLGTSTDVHDLRTLQSEQRVLVAELQHRTRNLIAVVSSICAQTMNNSRSLDDFRDRFESRLMALSRVQGLLSRSESDPITLNRLVTMELDAIGHVADGIRIRANGPEVVVRDSTAQTLALVVHELATNALKHGALSSTAGVLDISWRNHADGGKPQVRLAWEERAIDVDLKVVEQGGSGYGRLLIERALPYQFGASTRLLFTRDSIQCTIDLPLKHHRTGDTDVQC